MLLLNKMTRSAGQAKHCPDSDPSNNSVGETQSSELAVESLSPSASTSFLDETKSSSEFHQRLAANKSRQSSQHFKLLRENTRDFTVNKLRAVGFHGRQDESLKLKGCLVKTLHQGDNRRRQVAWIHGPSGCGKSRVASNFQTVVKKNGGLYISGKFDFNKRDEPYSGIASACRILVGELRLSLRDDENGDTPITPPFSFEDLKRDIIQGMGEDVSVMTFLIPDLQDIVMFQEQNSKNNDIGASSLPSWLLSHAQHRFHNAFRRFFCIIAKHFAALVICLDDLQWSDQASLDIIKVLLTDRNNPNIMFIGCYRSNEQVNPSLSNLQTLFQQDTERFETIDLPLGEWNVSIVNCVMADLLGMDQEATHNLAELCHKKTNGNAFYLLSFVQMLHESEQLQFNFGSMRWTWDLQAIQRNMEATRNVVELTRAKIDKSDDLKRLFPLAACLGSEFKEAILEILWKTEVGTGNLAQLLDLAVQEGFLEVIVAGSCEYRWLHDKIIEAVLSLMDPQDLAALQHRIGQTLVNTLDPKTLELSLFMVVDLLNRGTDPNLSNLNLLAAKKAIELSAFQSASKYISKGIAHLPPKNRNNYKLALDLYATGAEIEGSLGNVVQMEMYCKEIIEKIAESLFDKLRAYHALMTSIANRDRLLEAIKLCLGVLRQLECTFPKTSVGVTISTLAGLVRIGAKVKSLSPDFASTLTLMTDRRKIEAMRLMSKLFLYCYLSKNPLIALPCFKMVEWTLKYGACASSCMGFVYTGVLATGILVDLEAGALCGKYASQLVAKAGAGRSIESEVEFVRALLMPWTVPMRKTLDSFHAAYELGMRSGNTEHAALSHLNLIIFGYQAGLTLGNLEEQCRSYIPQMRELLRDRQASISAPAWQLILNLQGRAEDPLILTGDGLNQAEYEDLVSQPGNEELLSALQVPQQHLYAYLGEHKLGAELALKRGDNFQKSFPAGCWCMSDLFLRSFALYAMAGQSKKNRAKYSWEASRLHRKITSLVRKGNPNTRHYQAILDAEAAVLKQNSSKANELYKKAIVMAGRSGFVQDAALASERFGEYLLGQTEGQDEAKTQLEGALCFYKSWGATLKVERLQKKHNALWPQPREVSTDAIRNSGRTQTSELLVWE